MLNSLLITPEATIRDAMVAIDRGAMEIALVVDADFCLVGTVSDGDVRRALLAGRALDDAIGPHCTTEPMTVGREAGRAEVLELMRARALNQIPVVDSGGRLVSLHLIQQLLGRTERPNWAVVMAGGRGARLAPMTDTIPKPMLRVAGRPILERIVLHLIGSGIQRIFLSVNYLREIIEEHFGDGSQFGCRIDYLREDPGEALGTGGSLRLLLEEGHEPRCPLLVMNGDLVTEFSVDNLFASHEVTGACATMGVRDYLHTVPFGVVETAGSRLVQFVEKPTKSWLVNAGIYVLEPRLLHRIPAGEFHVPQLLAESMDRGERINTWMADDEWQDIGRPNELRRAAGMALVS